MKLEIAFIAAEQTFPLRKEVLQPSAGGDSVVLDKDYDDSTFHLGGIADNKVISIGTFHRISHPEFKEPIQYQLRKMATSPEYRSMGAGKKLLEFGIDHLKKKGVDLLWCNAREIAIGFYERLGFEAIGNFFEVSGIGPHKLMFINLKSH